MFGGGQENFGFSSPETGLVFFGGVLVILGSAVIHINDYSSEWTWFALGGGLVALVVLAELLNLGMNRRRR